MKIFSTGEAARKLGIGLRTLTRYIEGKKVPAPPVHFVGAGRVRAWSDADIEKVRKILPRLANGRKTRYKKKKK